MDLYLSGGHRKLQANDLAYRDLNPHHRREARLAEVHGFSSRDLAVARVNTNVRLEFEAGMAASIGDALRLTSGELVLEIQSVAPAFATCNERT